MKIEIHSLNKLQTTILFNKSILKTLGIFLTQEIKEKNISNWLKWIIKGGKPPIPENIFFLDSDNEYIYIEFQLDENKENILKINKIELIKILKKWNQTIYTKPNKIMITEDNGVFDIFEVQ